MSTELAVEKPAPKTITITITNETIETLKTEASALRIEGIEVVDKKVIVNDFSLALADKDGLKAVKAMRMRAVKARTTCKAEHSAIKEDALRECQRIDKSNREMQAAIAAIEAPLLLLETAIENELDRLAEIRKAEILRQRKESLLNAGAEPHHMIDHLLGAMDNDAFEKHLAFVIEDKKQREAAAAERARVEEEARIERERQAELQRQEQERLDAERKRLEEQRAAAEKELTEQRAKLAAEQAEAEKKAAAAREELAAEQARIKAQSDEIEHQKRLAETKLEADRIASENAAAAERKKIQDAAAELESQQRAHKEAADALESQRLMFEHEQEQAATNKIVEKMRSDADEYLAPYEDLSVTLPVQAWHDAAALSIWNWAMDYMVNHDRQPGEPLGEGQCQDAIAEIIHRYDPAMTTVG